MATSDLSTYDLGELKGLQHAVQQEIKNRQKNEVQKAREQILSIAQELGMSVAELLVTNPKTPKARKKGQKVQPQYRNPANNSQTWTGRGRQPKWVAEGIKAGKSLDEFRI